MIKESEKPTVIIQKNSERSRRSFSFNNVLDGFAIGVIVFMLFVVIAAYLLEINFNSDISLKDVGVRTALLYVSTVTVSLMLRVLALRRGRRTEKYQEMLKMVADNNDVITENGLSKYRVEYCKEWEEKELAEVRACVLVDVGLTLNDFNIKYCKYTKQELSEMEEFKCLTKTQLKAIESARRIKRLKYDVNYLSVRRLTRHRSSPSGGLNSSDWHRIKTAQTLAVCLIASVFTVYIGVEATYISSWANFVSCLIKVTTMIISGVIAYVSGYYFSSERETAELNEKAHEQKNFIKWCEKKAKD